MTMRRYLFEHLGPAERMGGGAPRRALAVEGGG